jgi:hypothetical protein
MPLPPPFLGKRFSLSAHLGPVLLVASLLLGGALRFYAIAFGLPDQYARPDERVLISSSLGLFSGDLNPRYFPYPTLFMYVLFFLYGIYLAFGFAFDLFKDLTDLQLAYFVNLSPFCTIARATSATLGTLSLALIYLVGKRLYSKEVGLVVALFRSLTFLSIRDSHFGVTDVPATFFTLLAFLFIVDLLRHGSGSRYVLAGRALGVAASAKSRTGLNA